MLVIQEDRAPGSCMQPTVPWVGNITPTKFYTLNVKLDQGRSNYLVAPNLTVAQRGRTRFELKYGQPGTTLMVMFTAQAQPSKNITV